MGPTRGRDERAAVATDFADSSRTVASAGVPLPGSVAPAVFYGECRSSDPNMSRKKCGLGVAHGADPRGTEFWSNAQTVDAASVAPGVDPLGKHGWSDMQAVDTARMVPGSKLLADTDSGHIDTQGADTRRAKIVTKKPSDRLAADTARMFSGSTLLADTNSVQNETYRADTPSENTLATKPRQADTRRGGMTPGAVTPGGVSVVRNAQSRDTCYAGTTMNVSGSVSVTPRDGAKETHSVDKSNALNETRKKQQSLNTRLEEQKSRLSEGTATLVDKQRIIHEMADTGSAMLTLHEGRLGDVARGIGGTLVSPPLELSDVKKYFGDRKGFPEIDKLLEIVGEGAPAHTHDQNANLIPALEYGNHRSVDDHLPQVWEKLFDDVRRNRCIILKKVNATEVRGIRVAPLGVVPGKKVRIINDYSFDPGTKTGKKGGLNKDTVMTEVPPCLCGEAMPSFLGEITSLRARWPDKRILMAKADVASAFRNVRISPDHAQKFCYVLGDVLVADLRLTFGWAASPGLWGVMASAAEHSHRNTNASNVQLLDEGVRMMSHVKITPPWEVGPPKQLPAEANVKPHTGGGSADDYLATVYVDDFLLSKVQHGPEDQSALVASASLASDHVRLFGPGEAGEIPILAPKKSTDWDSVIEALGYTIDTHEGRIATTPERVEAIRSTLESDWPSDRKQASVQDVLSIAGKLWNLTYVIRAGRYFVWQLLRLTGLHTPASRQARTRNMVGLGREFHGDIAFWKWVLKQPLATKGESLSASFLLHVKRTPFRLYLSDASLEAIGGYCPELKIFWRYTINAALSAELKRKGAAHETSDITINLLELGGMFMTAWVVQMVLKDRPQEEGQSVLMRGDNVSAVSWTNRCGGSRDKRASLLMRLMGRMEIACGWCHVAKHIPGRENTLADGISRWDADKVAANVEKLTKDSGWKQVDIGVGGRSLFEILLEQPFPKESLDDRTWGIMLRG